MNTTQLDLPFSYNDFDENDIYVDQSPNCGFVSSFYTPEGIRHLDSDFCQEIREFRGSESKYKKLRFQILSNKHLHSVIKQNLVHNLDQYYNSGN